VVCPKERGGSRSKLKENELADEMKGSGSQVRIKLDTLRISL
jgi:hypothetical protein